MVWYLTKQNWKHLGTYKKHTTWIFISLVTFEFILFLRYFFNLNERKNYGVIIIIGEFLQSIAIYLVCSMFAKKASNKLADMSWIP
jgi:hypothetical protein